MSRLPVTLIMRAPQERSFSIEAVFETVTAHLPEDIDATVVTSAFPSSGLLPRLRAAWHARQASKDARVVHMTGDAHFLLLLIGRKRSILTVHDCEFLERSSGLRRFVLWLFWLRLPVAFAGAVTVVSEASKAQLLRWLTIDSDRIEVIENPLSKRLPRAQRSFARRPKLLMIGTGPHKNIDRAASAIAGLPVTLTVIGRIAGDRLSRIQNHVEITSRYDLTDTELAQVYADSDILLFPSLSEGFGLPIIEAQSVGCLVITSCRAPMSDVAGDAALKVDPEDTAAIRAAVERLISDSALRDKLRIEGFENVARFDPSKAARAYAMLYRRIAAGEF